MSQAHGGVTGTIASFFREGGMRARLGSGVFWSLASYAFTQGGTFLGNVAIARILGLQLFGEYGMVQTTQLTVANVAMLAMGLTATKYAAEYRTLDKARAGRALGLCSAVTTLSALAACAGLLLASPLLATRTLNAPHLTTGLWIASVTVFFSTLNGYQFGALGGLEGFRRAAWASGLGALAHVPVCAAGAGWGGLNGALASVAASGLVRWLVFRLVLRAEAESQGIRIAFEGAWQEKRILKAFAIPAAAAGLTAMPSLWASSAILANRAEGFAQLALYTAADNLRVVVLFLPRVINGVGTTLINSVKGEGREGGYRRMFWANFGLVVGAALAGAAAVALAGKLLLALYGKDFGAGFPVLLLLLASVVPEGLALALYQVLVSKERMWLAFFAASLPRDVALVFFALLLTAGYGARGLALAYLLAWSLAACSLAVAAAFTGLKLKGAGPAEVSGA